MQPSFRMANYNGILKDAAGNALYPRPARWIKAGSATGSAAVTYPATATELYIKVTFTSANNITYAGTYMVESLSERLYYLPAYYFASSNYACVSCFINGVNRTITMFDKVHAGHSYTDSSVVLDVWYRE